MDRDELYTKVGQIEERIKTLDERFGDVCGRLETHLDKFGDVAQKVYLLDARNGHKVDDLVLKVQALEIHTRRYEVVWVRAIDSAWKIGMTLITAFILWHLGIKW